MKYTRQWKQSIAVWDEIAVRCRMLTDDGWAVHTIMPTENIGDESRDGAIIIAFKDEPDLSGGVPR